MKRTVAMKNAGVPGNAPGAPIIVKKPSQKKLKKLLMAGRLSEKGKDQIKDEKYQEQRRAQRKAGLAAAAAAP